MKELSWGGAVRTVYQQGFAHVVALGCVLSLAACTGGVSESSGGSSTSTAPPASTPYTVGGTVTGLTGGGLVLQNNGVNNLTVGSNGAFMFSAALVSGNVYNVSVLAQPGNPTQTCTPSNAAGTVGAANITSVTITCVNKPTGQNDLIGGSVAGLAGTGLVLQDNGGDSLQVSANGRFTFATALPSGSAYSVTVLSPPIDPYQNCTVTAGTGITGESDVNNVAVACTTTTAATHTISGSVTGLAAGAQIVLEDNGRDSKTITANGPFAPFATPIPSGSAYSVSIAQESDPTQSIACTVTNGSGVVGSSNISNVAISCGSQVQLVVTVAGLNGTGLELQDSAGETLVIAANGPAAFSTGLSPGSPYQVSILEQPTNQTCALAYASGTVGSGPSPSVTCINNPTVGGTVTGLMPGRQLILLDNGTGALPVSANGTFVFPAAIAYKGSYAVTIQTQPVGQTCSVANGTGTGITANVTTVAVSCAVNTYTIGGSVAGGGGVTGLGSGDQVTLLDNGGNALTATANGPFVFTTPIPYNGSYLVTVSAQPTGQTCTVNNGSGAGVVANVTNVAVVCSVDTYAISGLLSGLGTGLQVALEDNGTNLTTLLANGQFGFSTQIAYNGSYNVTVATQPTGQTCTVTNGSGAGVVAPISNVGVNCSVNTYPISVTVTGLTVGQQITFDLNGADPLTVTTNGTYTFTTQVVYNGSYSVTVGTQPVAETCTVANPSGSGVVAAVNLAVNCSTNTYPVSGTLSGLGTGDQVTLDENGANPLTLTANGPFTLPPPIPYNGSYLVTVGTQPIGETCGVTNGSGSGVTAPVTNVIVGCSVDTYQISVDVTGLTAGQQVTFDLNGADPLTVTADGTYSFTTQIPYNGTYTVTIGTQPVAEACSVLNPSGSAVTAPVTLSVSCAPITYTIGGYLSGLQDGDQITLLDNGGDALTLFANNTFTFATPIPYNGSYAVTVGTQPNGESCTVTSGTGANVEANVNSVLVACTAAYSISGTYSGVAPGATFSLENTTNSDIYPITAAQANGSFTLDQLVPAGGSYSVEVYAQPLGQTCTVANASGSSVEANVTNVSITCTYLVGGQVNGLIAADVINLTLLNSQFEPITAASPVGTAGSPPPTQTFTFPVGLALGSGYFLSVTPPSDEVCTVNSPPLVPGTPYYGGTVDASSYQVVSISCSQAYAIGGTISGLAATDPATITYTINGGAQSQITTTTASFTLGEYATGSTYSVVSAAASGYDCSVTTGGSGTASPTSLDAIGISCTAIIE
jgi:hypothetical protein